MSKQFVIKEQEDIMQVVDKSLIVSASAGSGKTTVMIRKILDYIVTKKAQVDELLVLTYTKASAQEMKKKLVTKLKEVVKQNPELEEQLDLVQTSDVCTFDSFCQKLVKKYFYILDISPAFNILQGSDEMIAKSDAIKNAINILKQENIETYENLLSNLSTNRDEENIKNLVFKIYDYTTSILHEDKFFEDTLKLYDADFKICENYIKQNYNQSFDDYILKFENLRKQCVDLNLNTYTDFISLILCQIEGYRRETDFCKMLDLINSSEKFPTLYKNKLDEVGLKDVISTVRDEYKKFIDNIIKQYIDRENVEKSYVICQKLMQNLLNLVKIFKKEYQKLKFLQNMFDFNDIERLTIKLLENSEILQEIKSGYKYIFVDEFQDANAVQEKIIFLLQNNNLFFVGDTKQSIYAFRQSDPEIFLKIQNDFNNSQNAENLTLNCNFRTNKNILDFVNKIFCILMTDVTCNLNYKKDAQFNPMAQYQDLKDEVCVDLNIILENEQEKNVERATKLYSVKQNANQIKINTFDEECLLIAQKIAEVIGIDIYDKESEQIKKVSYSDITILLLKRGEFLNSLIKTFSALNIPYVVNLNDNLEDMYDVKVLHSLLKYSCYPFDEYSLYFILTSDLFGFSDTELAYIKQQTNGENLCDCLQKYSLNCDKLAEKIKNFYNFIDNFNFNLKYKGIYTCLSNAVKDTNYLLNIQDQEDFSERKLNIEAYIDSFQNSKFNYNVIQYLSFRENSTRQNKRQTDKTNNDSVEITTMHSSKGLEYPVVILPNLSQDYTKEPDHLMLKINKEFGVGIKYCNDEERTVSSGIFYNACKLKNKEIELSEKIRLLYVAMTRAKNRLILTGKNTKVQKIISTDYDVITSNNFLSLICGCLPQDVLDKISNNDEFSCNLFNNPKLKLNCSKILVENLQSNDVSNIPEINIDVSKLNDFLNKDVSENKLKIALKNSVSEYAFDQNASLNFEPKNFTLEEHLQSTASDTGTLYHSLLENIIFNDINNIDDIKNYVECNFCEEEILVLQKIGYENILKNIKLIVELIDRSDIVLKEQKFVMNINHNELVSGGLDDKILIQGIIDMVVVKSDKILLFDYKLTHKSEELIKQTYAKQLDLYELALKKGFKNLPIKKYIVDLYKNKLIQM